jgi:hypothetical protein
VSNLSPLSFLYNLLDLRLEWNQIGDISALSSNESFDSSTTITLEMNPMTATTVCSDIAVLAGFGVTVTHNVAACGANVDVIPDLALETALKDVLILLGANPGATIEASELTGVGLSLLSVDNLGIRSLQGLQFATDLVSITITNNDITDLSPIANLSSLAYLNLNGNRITNINHIGGISNLNTLLLNNNLIGDISPLANLTNLNILSLKNNTIHDISPLEFLTLDKLYLDENQIVDISHIAGMTSLNTLSLAENFIGDIEPILQNAGIANGDVVNIASNPLNAMSYCVSIPELESFNITVIHDNIPCADFIDRFEPDANPDQAKTLEPGRIITTLSLIDILPDVDDVDWTKFTLTQTAEVAIESIAGTLEPKNAQIETTIYPENLSAPIASSSGTILLNLAPGTYYLKTEEVNGLFIGNYAIRVNADYQEPGNDDIATNATPLTIGQPGDIHTLTGGEIIPGVIASFNMEEDPGWILDDEILDGEWEFGNPSGDGGYPLGNPDPAAGATGLNVFGVNLSGNYDDSVGGPFYLTTPAIDCSRAENVTLEFQRWLNTDYQPYVTVTVEVSTDGTLWNTLWQNGGSFIQDSSWSLQTFDISNYADHQKTVFIRWGYQNFSDVIAFSGWNIDDVQIKGDIQRLSNDVDWYTFTINNNRYLQFSATTMFGNAKMETFGPDDPNQPFIQHYVSDNDILFFPEMPAGQYWVRVTEYHGDKAYDYRGDIPAYSFFVEGQGNPDQYEDDDTVENATIVNLDPVIAGGLRILKQTHNFHDVGDEDWCVMVVPEPEIHPIIGLTDLGPRANPVIDVFADDGTTLLATGSGTIIIDFNTQPDELFYIRVRNADPNVFGIGTAYGINGSGGTEIGGSVVGFIYDPNGSPVSGIRLTIPSPDAGNPDIRSTVSAPDGFYFFGNVPLGHHTATYPATCGIDLDVHIFVQSSNEHNVPVHMEGCPAPNPFDVFVNLSIGQNSNENGTQTRPFSKLAPGVNSVSSGGRVHLRGTKTGEIFTGQLVINKRMTLLAENINGVSPVRIGQP